ncbi:MAG: hypothetical protein QMD08_03375 [Actinomycetota bacterium]|nr:hypothetical protein [Actinomycetota bacterium]
MEAKWENIPICAVIHRCSMGVMTVCPAFKASRPCWEVEGVRRDFASTVPPTSRRKTALI